MSGVQAGRNFHKEIQTISKFRIASISSPDTRLNTHSLFSNKQLVEQTFKSS